MHGDRKYASRPYMWEWGRSILGRGGGATLGHYQTLKIVEATSPTKIKYWINFCGVWWHSSSESRNHCTFWNVGSTNNVEFRVKCSPRPVRRILEENRTLLEYKFTPCVRYYIRCLLATPPTFLNNRLNNSTCCYQLGFNSTPLLTYLIEK